MCLSFRVCLRWILNALPVYFSFFLWNLLVPLFSLLWKMLSVYLVLCFFRGIAVCSALNTYEQTNLCLEVGALYSINLIPYQANRVSVSVFYLKIDINNAKWIRTIAIITWITTQETTNPQTPCRERWKGKSELFWLALLLYVEVLASSIASLTNLLKVVIILKFEIHSFI